MEDSGELIQLEEVVLRACSGEVEWPARIAAGIYAGVDFAIAHPGVVESFYSDLEDDAWNVEHYERIIGRFTGFLQALAPIGKRLPGSTDTALVGGVVDLVGDYLRLGRSDRLVELRPDLVLLVLLPYLGFAEAKGWVDRIIDLAD
jgi:hypothetical protein